MSITAWPSKTAAVAVEGVTKTYGVADRVRDWRTGGS
jgi:hypothetical protein